MRSFQCLTVLLLLSCEQPAGPMHASPSGRRDSLWSPQPASMQLLAAREWHSATLLTNGKVLVAGGRNGALLRSTELYDTLTGTWSSGPDMVTARSSHFALMLPNGKVLAAGGNTVSVNVTAETYDPVTNVWTSVPNLPNGHQDGVLNWIPDAGPVFTGGFSNGTSANRFNLNTSTWAPAAPLNGAGANAHATAVLSDGRLLLLASSTQALNFSSGWLNLAPMPGPSQFNHTATVLGSGLILTTGGQIGADSTPETYRYDPVANTWSVAAPMSTAREDHNATLLPNGKVLVVGGVSEVGPMPVRLSSTEVYDPVANTWADAGSLSATSIGTSTLLPNGKVLTVVGASLNPSFRVELYDYQTPTVTSITVMPIARDRHTATVLGTGDVLLTGGENPNAMADSRLYRPSTDTWLVTGSLLGARRNHRATLLPNGDVLVSGGVGVSTLSSAEIYSTTAGTWSATASMSAARATHSATLLPNGGVLVTGGQSATGATLGTAEIFFSPGGWAWARPMLTPRRRHTATLLSNGNVLVVGGMNGNAQLGSAEVYDVAANVWAAAGSVTPARTEHAATLLPSGDVLVTGGQGATALDSAQLFNPGTNAWSAAASMTVSRYRHTAVLLLNGSVAVFGGLDTAGNHLASIEIYDPVANKWTTSTPMSVIRSSFTASLLPTGKVLLAGGENTMPLIRAELFDEGRASQPSRTPSLVVLTPGPVSPGGSLSFPGTLLAGGPEASGGNELASPTNYPVVVLRREDNEGTLYAPVTSYSSTQVTATVPALALPGAYRAHAVVSGIPSLSGALQIIPASDTTPPDTNIALAPPALSNSTGAEFGLQSNEAGVTYQCSLDGAAFVACNALAVFTGLAQGNHILQVRAVDSNGNIDASPATHSWTVDSVPPDSEIVSGPPPFTTATTVTFQFTSTEANSSYECKLDANPWFACSTPYTVIVFPLGSHTFLVRATDPAGNLDQTPASHNWTVIAPTDGGLDGGVDGGLDGGLDGGGLDGGGLDGGGLDGGEVDGGLDGGGLDGGEVDGGLDGGEVDGGLDGGGLDSGKPDAGRFDGGTDGGGAARTLRVGCDCQSSSGYGALGLVALLGLTRGRRRWHSSAERAR